MRYVSTRDKNIWVDDAQGILQGISKEGGLFVPSSFPEIEDLGSLLDMTYGQVALYTLEKFFPGLGHENLVQAVNKAYDSKFSTEEIVAIKDVKGVSFLELYHGPTLAFKDMALSILPHLIGLAKNKLEIKEDIVILTATSGDTGKAALEGFANVEGIKIIVFYPEEGVSKIQKLQMTSQEGDNTLVLGIRGNFDHAQSGVKEIFNNKEFIEELEKNNYILSSANSINIGRLVPQIAYYLYTYIQMVKGEEIVLGDKINIVVPTGNFGNILAAYYGKVMGLPVNKLICGSNDNKVLTEFFNEGKYDINKDLILTSSPSMDILISSNLERLLFHINNGNHELVKEKMGDLRTKAYYEISDLKGEDFYANYANEEEVTKAIREMFKENYLMDSHTAVAYSVYKKYKEESKDTTKTVIVSTASPFKFGDKVASSIGIEIKDMDEFKILDEISYASNLKVPENIKALKEKEIRHKKIIGKEDMERSIREFLQVGEAND